MRRRLAASGLLILLAAGCSAHFRHVDEPMFDLEPLWMGVPIARGQLFEAELPHHVVFHNGLDRTGSLEAGGFSTALSFSFVAHVRVMSSWANPVLPPSYLPRLKLQLIEVVPLGAEGARHAQRLAGVLAFSAGHRTNGQTGCALAGGVPRTPGGSDFDCVWPAGVTPSADLNLENGAFSANLVSADLSARWLLFPGDGGFVQRSLAGRIGVDWMPSCRFAGCIDPALRARYGEVMIRWGASGEWVLIDRPHRALPFSERRATDSRLRASLYGAFNRGVEAGFDPFWFTAAELAWLTHFEAGGSGGPFVRYWRGRDDLNLRFERNHSAVTVGYLVELAAPLQLAGGAPGGRVGPVGR
jgi:hypothetical protein